MSRLENVSAPFRKANIARNDYNSNKEYTNGSPDVISDGDEKGKELNNGQVGGTTDIKTRDKLIAKNKYNKNKEYNAGTA